MKTIDIGAATRPLAEYASELGDDVVVVTDHDQAVAMLIPLKHIDAEALALGSSAEFLSIIEAARREVADGRTLSFEELKRALESL